MEPHIDFDYDAVDERPPAPVAPVEKPREWMEMRQTLRLILSAGHRDSLRSNLAAVLVILGDSTVQAAATAGITPDAVRRARRRLQTETAERFSSRRLKPVNKG